MEQYSVFQPNNVISVGQLSSYLRQILEDDAHLQDVWVQGEISNFARPSSGHLYFTLKDSQAAIRCVMWRSAAARLRFDPREGLAVEAHGAINIYEVSGQLQLYIDTMNQAGEGALFAEYQRLKARLEAEGLFDQETKRPIPTLPTRIGIVTSPTGAAFQDMINTLGRRYPIADVVLCPTAVQGADAPPQIVAALAYLNREAHPDVILIGRGGGSIEDLWAFNDEAVVRAVAGSSTPIISGVGHETDFTLTDFAADLRAPTPTAAAEMATPDRADLLAAVAELAHRHSTTLREKIAALRWDFGQTHNTLQRLSPEHTIDTYRQRLDEISYRVDRSIKSFLERKSVKLDHLTQALGNLNPHAVLNRGYAIVTRGVDGKVVRSSGQVSPADKINIQVSQGSMEAQITKTNPGGS